MHESDWRPSSGNNKKHGHEVWDHRGPHMISDGEVDGEISFSDEVLGMYAESEKSEDDE